MFSFIVSSDGTDWRPVIIARVQNLASQETGMSSKYSDNSKSK